MSRKENLMGFKALVADDEYMIRKGIMGFLEKHDNFEVVAEAEDGEMALELALEKDIDVYFVDINMPFVNGLEFIGKLKEIRPKALVVLITGYDRFDYAQEALKLGAFEYLLKPIMEDTFEEMIRRVEKKLEDDISGNKYLKWAQAMLIQNRDNLMDDFLHKTLEGHFTNEEISERMKYLQMTIPEKFMVMVVQMEYQEAADVKRYWNDDLLFFVARNVGNEIFGELKKTGSCQDSYGNLVIVSEDIGDEETQRRVEQYKKLVEEYIPVKVDAIWEKGSGYEELPEKYQEVINKLSESKGISAVVQDVQQLIENNFGEKDFSLQDASDHVNLSPQHLSRIFKKEKGVTFIDYLTSVRIRKAIELFQDDELKIYDIAEQTGYATQHYFSNVFKKNLGVSPAEYRKIIKKDK